MADFLIDLSLSDLRNGKEPSRNHGGLFRILKADFGYPGLFRLFGATRQQRFGSTEHQSAIPTGHRRVRQPALPLHPSDPQFSFMAARSPCSAFSISLSATAGR